MNRIMLIAGILLMVGTIIYGASLPKTTTTAPKIISYGILGGFALIFISGFLYLKS